MSIRNEMVTVLRHTWIGRDPNLESQSTPDTGGSSGFRLVEQLYLRSQVPRRPVTYRGMYCAY